MPIHPNSLKNLTYRFPKGGISPMVGKKHSDETKEKIRLAHLGKKFTIEHLMNLSKNNARYWFGKKRPEVKKWLIPLKAGIYKHTEEIKRKISESHSGNKHYRWNPNREEIIGNKRDNTNAEYHLWARNVKKRDGWKCKLRNYECSGKLEAHHILPWSKFPELRYKLNNGIALCQNHHPRSRDGEIKLAPVFQEIVTNSLVN